MDRWQLIDLVGDYRISTVELPIFINGQFETMVFLGEDWSDLDSEQYETKEDAIEGHKKMVEKWREKIKVSS